MSTFRCPPHLLIQPGNLEDQLTEILRYVGRLQGMCASDKVKLASSGAVDFFPLLLANTSHASELPVFDYAQTCAAEGGVPSDVRTCMAAQRAARRILRSRHRRPIAF